MRRDSDVETDLTDEDGDNDDDASAGSELWAIPDASLDAPTVDSVLTCLEATCLPTRQHPIEGGLKWNHTFCDGCGKRRWPSFPLAPHPTSCEHMCLLTPRERSSL